MSQFDQLMAELGQLGQDHETMAKALPADSGADEAKIQAAAAEGGAANEKKPGEGEGGEGEGGETVAKSFSLTLEDGTTVEAFDGEAMVKALTARIDANETATIAALNQAVGLIKGQATMLKSMGEKLQALSNGGAGRKAVLSIIDKPLVKSVQQQEQPAGMTTDQFFAKAHAAQKEGRITGGDIALAETLLNRGEQIPAHIVQRVIAS